MTTKTVAKKTTTKKQTTKTVQKSTKTFLQELRDNRTVPAFFPKYPEYRMADMVATTYWREENVGKVKKLKEYVANKDEVLKDYILRLFPNSIASQYLSKTKRANDMTVLSGIINEFVPLHKIKLPAKDVMVMHLRVGDVIDSTKIPFESFLKRRVNSYYALYGNDPDDWSPVYVRCLASFDRALKKTKGLGFHKISLVYGFHIRGQPIDKSKKYIAALAQYAESQGFEVELITHGDADVSFAYACNAKHFIPGGGGYSKLMATYVRSQGNNVYQVRV